jgi:hypothetical protein
VHYYRFDQSGQAGLQCIVIKALKLQVDGGYGLRAAH